MSKTSQKSPNTKEIPDDKFYIVVASASDARVEEFTSKDEFVARVSDVLRTLANTSSKVYLFKGARIPYGTEQVAVGIHLPGEEKPVAVVLRKSSENPEGAVPQVYVRETLAVDVASDNQE